MRAIFTTKRILCRMYVRIVQTGARAIRGRSCCRRFWADWISDRCRWTRTVPAEARPRRTRTLWPPGSRRPGHRRPPPKSPGCWASASWNASSNRWPPRTPIWCTPTDRRRDNPTLDCWSPPEIRRPPTETTFSPSPTVLSLLVTENRYNNITNS